MNEENELLRLLGRGDRPLAPAASTNVSPEYKQPVRRESTGNAIYDFAARNPLAREVTKRVIRRQEGATGEWAKHDRSVPTLLDKYFWPDKDIGLERVDDATHNRLRQEFNPRRVPEHHYRIPDEHTEFHQDTLFDKIRTLPEDVQQRILNIKEGERLNLTPHFKSSEGNIGFDGMQDFNPIYGTRLDVGSVSYGMRRTPEGQHKFYVYDVYDFEPESFSTRYSSLVSPAQARLLDQLGKPFGLYGEHPIDNPVERLRKK
jgi:hypothetical protein